MTLVQNESMSEPEPEPAAERVIAGRYRLQHVLGNGSMGTVWSAYDEFLHRNVAVKEVLLPHGIPKQEADALRERTLREARATAMLSHPNVVTLHDVARQDGEPFIVMELMPSHSLAEIIDEHGPLSIIQTAAVADAVAAALEAAHHAGITHRDVKPGNVLIGLDGRIKLNDFGIARNVAETTMTSTGIMLGSPAYIAPEVASGRKATPAADQWSLGATLFAMVEGRPPYDAEDDPLRTVTEVVHGDVPMPPHADELEPVITGLMVKDPEARISLAQVRSQVRPLLPENGNVTFPVPSSRAVSSKKTPVRPRVSAARSPRSQRDRNAPLADDPGPLPFMSAQPAPNPKQRATGIPERSPAKSVVLLIMAIVLFVAAVAGGFVAVRKLSGLSLFPPQTTANPAPSVSVSISLAPTAASGFSLPTPSGWQQFTEQRIYTYEGLPTSTVVHFVSNDGSQDLTVQRFSDYYPDETIKNYLVALSQREPNYNTVSGLSPLVISGITGNESPRELAYRTAETATSSQTSKTEPPTRYRSAFAAIIPVNSDLWVITLVVPTDTETQGRELFDQIVPHFKITG